MVPLRDREGKEALWSTSLHPSCVADWIKEILFIYFVENFLFKHTGGTINAGSEVTG